MILFLGKYLIGDLECHHLINYLYIQISIVKKKIQSSVWQVRNNYYDRKKKNTVVSLAGAQSITTGKK